MGGSARGDSSSSRKRSMRGLEQERKRERGQGVSAISADKRQNISFGPEDLEGISIPHNNPLVISMDVACYEVRRVLVSSGSVADILSLSAFEQLGLKCSMLKPIRKLLQGLGGAMIKPLGSITLQTTLGEGEKRRVESIEYLVVDAPFPYNVILGCPALNQFQAVISTLHLKVKFPTPTGVGEVRGIQKQVRSCQPQIRAETGRMSFKERLDQKQEEFEARKKARLEEDMESHYNYSTITLYEAYCNANTQTVALEAQNQTSTSPYVELHDKSSRFQLDYQEQSHKMVELEAAHRAQMQEQHALMEQAEASFQPRLEEARLQGKLAYQASEEFLQTQMRRDKEVVRNFKKSARGKSWVEERGAEYFSIGFSRCQLQFENSGLFPTDTPLNFLDMNLRMEGELDIEPIKDNDDEDDEVEA